VIRLFICNQLTLFTLAIFNWRFIGPTLKGTIESTWFRKTRPIISTQVTFGQLDQRYAISSWIQSAKVLVNDCHSHADLYAKVLQMYLKYPTHEQWFEHWHQH